MGPEGVLSFGKFKTNDLWLFIIPIIILFYYQIYQIINRKHIIDNTFCKICVVNTIIWVNNVVRHPVIKGIKSLHPFVFISKLLKDFSVSNIHDLPTNSEYLVSESII